MSLRNLVAPLSALTVSNACSFKRSSGRALKTMAPRRQSPDHGTAETDAKLGIPGARFSYFCPPLFEIYIDYIYIYCIHHCTLFLVYSNHVYFPNEPVGQCWPQLDIFGTCIALKRAPSLLAALLRPSGFTWFMHRGTSKLPGNSPLRTSYSPDEMQQRAYATRSYPAGAPFRGTRTSVAVAGPKAVKNV